jgi:hypothetical protein
MWSITHTTMKGVCVSCFFDRGIPTSQQHDVALHERHKSDTELPSVVFFFFLLLQKIQVGKPARITTLLGYPD